MLTFVTFDQFLKKLILQPRTEEESANHYEFIKNGAGDVVTVLKDDCVVHVMKPDTYRNVVDSMVIFFMNCVLKYGPSVFGVITPPLYRDLWSPNTNMEKIKKYGKCLIDKKELMHVYCIFSRINLTHTRGSNLLDLAELLDYIQEKKMGIVTNDGLEIRISHASRMIENHNHNNFNDMFLK